MGTSLFFHYLCATGSQLTPSKKGLPAPALAPLKKDYWLWVPLKRPSSWKILSNYMFFPGTISV
jgi:hypothetical protein